MKKKRGILALVIVLAILLLAIGYAAMSATTLSIENASVSAEGSQDDFIVHFSGGSAVTTEGATTDGVTVSGIPTTFTETTKAVTFSVSGMTKVGDKATVQFEVTNASAVSDINATLSALTDIWTTGTYFDVESANWDKPVISTTEGDNVATVTVVVKCIKTPTKAVSDTVTLSFTATPTE